MYTRLKNEDLTDVLLICPFENSYKVIQVKLVVYYLCYKKTLLGVFFGLIVSLSLLPGPLHSPSYKLIVRCSFGN